MYKLYNVTLDTQNDNKNQSFIVNNNDRNTPKIVFKIVQQNQPVILAGATVRLAVAKPDKTVVFQDCVVTNEAQGICEAVMNTQSFIVPGLYRAELMVYYAEDIVAVTGKFQYVVNKGVLSDDALQSKNDFQAINQAIADAEGILKDIRENGTGVDAQARTDITSLSAQTQQNFNSLNTQMAQKATQTDLEKKRDKSIPINEFDISDTLKLQITGGAPITTVLGAGSVSPLKTTFIKRGNQLFNKATAIVDKYISSTNGNVAANTSYYASDFIPVTGGSSYWRPNTHPHLAWYDSQMTYISGGDTTQVLTAPSNATYLRLSIPKADINTYRLVEGSSSKPYEDYVEYLEQNLIKEIPIAKVKGKFLKEQTDFFTTGKNKFDKSKITAGYYVNYSNGALSVNAGYNVSDYTEISANTVYIVTGGFQMAFYDENKVYVSGLNGGGITPYTFTTPSNAVYIRFSITPALTATCQLEQGNVATTYEPFQFAIPEQYIDLSFNPETIDVCLPSEICVAKGRTIEIYNNQIALCGNVDNWHFVWEAKNASNVLIGKSYTNKFSIPTDSNTQAGNYTLTLKVKDNNFNDVITKTSILKVVDVSTDISTPQSILPFGDSLINKSWLAETRTLANNIFGKDVLRWVGTKEPYAGAPSADLPYLKNEGRSGWQQSYYLTSGAKFAQILLAVSGVTTLPVTKKQYNIGIEGSASTFVYEVEECYDNNMNIITSGTVAYVLMNQVTNSWSTPAGQSTGGTITEVSSSVVGDSIITYSGWTSDNANPFWNPNTSAVDFNYYFTQKGITEPNAFVMFLGMNAISDTTSIITLLQTIQAQMTNKKVFVLLPHYKGDYQYNPTGKTQFFNFAKTIIEAVKTLTNVFIVPLYAVNDSVNNWNMTTENVNPRNSNVTVKRPSDITHPSNEGYYQFADSVFSTWLAHY